MIRLCLLHGIKQLLGHSMVKNVQRGILHSSCGSNFRTVTHCCTLLGTCACSRLLQTRNMGVSQVSIEEKVQNEANRPGPDMPEDCEVHTKPGDFRLMHKTIQSMRRCKAAAEGQQSVGILFEWQVHLFMHQASDIPVHNHTAPSQPKPRASLRHHHLHRSALAQLAA